MSASQYLVLGYVTGAHGLRGEVAVKPLDPDSDNLARLRRVLVRPTRGPERVCDLSAVRKTPKGFLVYLEGVGDRTSAEALKSAEVCAFREDLPPPEEGEYFQGDLIGLEAVGEDGATLGTVEEVWNTGPVPNLVIRNAAGDELLVPFADPFVSEVDLAQRRLVVLPPELLE